MAFKQEVVSEVRAAFAEAARCRPSRGRSPESAPALQQSEVSSVFFSAFTFFRQPLPRHFDWSSQQKSSGLEFEPQSHSLHHIFKSLSPTRAHISHSEDNEGYPNAVPHRSPSNSLVHTRNTFRSVTMRCIRSRSSNRSLHA